jgi:hypothetical protein
VLLETSLLAAKRMETQQRPSGKKKTQRRTSTAGARIKASWAKLQEGIAADHGQEGENERTVKRIEAARRISPRGPRAMAGDSEESEARKACREDKIGQGGAGHA